MEKGKRKKPCGKRPFCDRDESCLGSLPCCSVEQSCHLGEDSCCAGEFIIPQCEIGPQTPRERRDTAFEIRKYVAKRDRDLPVCKHPCNGDEKIYCTKIGNFSKGLPHNELGEVDLCAYEKLIEALCSGDSCKFEQLTLGGTAKLVDPQAAYAFDLMGADSHQPAIPPAPSFSSSQQAADMVELYWQALTKDIPFIDYSTNPLIQQAAAELSRLRCFIGPKVDGMVTPGTIFRGGLPGDLNGPFISQFLYKDIPLGSTPLEQKYRSPLPDQAFLTEYDEWLRVQNGGAPIGVLQYDLVKRYISTGRDMSEFVDFDFSFQSTLNAALILLGSPDFGQKALSPNNPYFNSRTQTGFVTFGAAHILDFTAKVARLALEAAWYNKWLVNRKLRPEAFGGAIQNNLTGRTDYPIDEQVLNSEAVALTFSRYGSYLLPQGYPGGCPLHPSYPGGHSTFSAAGITILKAFFNEDYVIPNPVQASSDGLTLLPYTDTPLTLGGELNKLTSNIALGRDTAGIHYRSDSVGWELGEYIAIRMLQDYCPTYNEDPVEFTLTKFDGTRITICCRKPNKRRCCKKRGKRRK